MCKQNFLSRLRLVAVDVHVVVADKSAFVHPCQANGESAAKAACAVTKRATNPALRFIGRGNLQLWTRVGTMNHSGVREIIVSEMNFIPQRLFP